MKTVKVALCAMLFASPLFVSRGLADQVMFKNGDQITGKIVQQDDTTITIDSAVAGTVKVDIKDVKTFSSDAPVTLKLKDGSVVNDKVTAGPDGSVTTAGTGSVKGQSISLDSLAAVNPPSQQWTGDIAAGGLITRGNSDSEQLNLTADATRRTDIDRILANAGYLYGRQKDKSTGINTTTTDNWFLGGEYDYFFTKQFYGYGLGKVERDRIANLDVRLTPGAGVGYQWIERPTLNADTEAGIGWLYESYINDGSNDYVNGRLAGHIDGMINDKVKLFADAEYLQSLENGKQFYVNTDAGARFTLTQRMFAEIKNEWKYDSAPAPGAKKNDIRWILGVGWQF